ncbi:peptidoglycan-binding protein [Aquimarina sp. TRL1]|uniref:peptidoglycan-binding domain-containing protein n=1 Tax=Aquimarina sp. (strain TRL1) TaxID=2736252 RepID=UPI00158EC824|nr:peptidoglycan-binding domain-containing protein [Aquimarina sp. TRL1]QKX05372.1 peptidoglycan-binding protein [Aquimarina sp. TRL1]
MRKESVPNKNNLTSVWIAITAFSVLTGAGYWLYRKRKMAKENEGMTWQSGIRPSSSSLWSRTSRFKCSSTKYPLTYGNCHEDVKILQRYLKVYNEDLGYSGKNRDGVDGQFGAKTAKAAKQRLKKDLFTKEDIQSIKTSLKMMKR